MKNKLKLNNEKKMVQMVMKQELAELRILIQKYAQLERAAKSRYVVYQRLNLIEQKIEALDGLIRSIEEELFE